MLPYCILYQVNSSRQLTRFNSIPSLLPSSPSSPCTGTVQSAPRAVYLTRKAATVPYQSIEARLETSIHRPSIWPWELSLRPPSITHPACARYWPKSEERDPCPLQVQSSPFSSVFSAVLFVAGRVAVCLLPS
jgi:hypothetical protein